MKAALSFRPDNSKNRRFFATGLFAVDRANTKLTQFLPSSICSVVLTDLARYVKMPVTKMLFGGDTLKIVCSVVSLITVNVVDLLKGIKSLQPASRNNPVHKTLPAQHEVSLCMSMGRVGVQTSKNFPTARDSVKMVKNSVLGASHRKVDHVVPFGGGYKDFILPLI